MTKGKKIAGGILCSVAVVAAVAGFVAYRGLRLYHVGRDWRTQVRYLIENGQSIGQAPASQTFAANYLDAIFGSDPELLGHLKGVISKGLAEDPSLNLGEVAAMIITYRRNGSGKIEDVVAHIAGGFPLGRRKPGFHRDGYFAGQLERDLWQAGTHAVGFLGRDLILFAEPDAEKRQTEILEAIFSGDIMPLVDSLDRPLYYTAVFPDPERLVPPQLRPHIQAMILKGHLAEMEGSVETIILTPSPKSATYALSLVHDMKLAVLMALRSRWAGVVEQVPWGTRIGSWWAYEIANTMESSSMEKDQNIVRVKSDFQRVMVNASLKMIERMGRDYAQQKRSLDERMDPRLVDASLQSRIPTHYWSTPHRWGPDWPIAAPSTNASQEAQAPPQDVPAVSPPP
jgi:hypothetical protein